MDRKAIENAVLNFYKKRMLNELAPCLECFSEGVDFRLAGAETVASLSARADGRDSLKPILKSLIDTWKWTKQELQSITIEGPQVAVRYRLTTTHVPTNTEIDTEIMDDIVFDNELKIVRLVEFVDTATAANPMGLKE